MSAAAARSSWTAPLCVAPAPAAASAWQALVCRPSAWNRRVQELLLPQVGDTASTSMLFDHFGDAGGGVQSRPAALAFRHLDGIGNLLVLPGVDHGAIDRLLAREHVCDLGKEQPAAFRDDAREGGGDTEVQAGAMGRRHAPPRPAGPAGRSFTAPTSSVGAFLQTPAALRWRRCSPACARPPGSSRAWSPAGSRRQGSAA